MRVRGERECRDCGTRWSYYESGSVECPACGSVRSRGVDGERRLHTAGAGELDLDEAREAVGEAPLHEVVDRAKEACREYVRADGFVRGGGLLDLDDVHLAARELVHVADRVGRSTTVDEDAELYLLDLLDGAGDGERPDADAVPAALATARGLAVAEGVRAYRRELREWLDEDPDRGVREPLERLDQHARRVAALQGEVPPAEAEVLVAATRDLARHLRDGDEAALATATDRLDRLDPVEGS